MRKVLAYTLVVFLLLLVSGCKRPRLMSEKTFSRVLEEMLLADIWLEEHPDNNAQADTSLFYDEIFSRHGYRFIDYDSTLSYYMANPEKYREVLEIALERVQDKIEKLDTTSKVEEEVSSDSSVEDYSDEEL